MRGAVWGRGRTAYRPLDVGMVERLLIGIGTSQQHRVRPRALALVWLAAAMVMAGCELGVG